jgi:hypothetical protein
MDGNRSNPFARLLGKLQYLANTLHPDILFAVNQLASYTANPSMQHYGMLKQILRYLSGTRDHGITYQKWGFNPQLIVYTDAAHANTNAKSLLPASSSYQAEVQFYGDPRNKRSSRYPQQKQNMLPCLTQAQRRDGSATYSRNLVSHRTLH